MLRTILTITVLVSAPTLANAWKAQDSIRGDVIEIFSPLEPKDVGASGGHEIQYRVLPNRQLRLGEATSWLTKCHGSYCLSKTTRTFELNTFSERGLMYVFPIDE